MTRNSDLKKQIERQVKRMKQSKLEEFDWLEPTTYIGTLGLVFILPVLAGAYLGDWLDRSVDGYSLHWTLSLLFLGIIIGIMNIYFLVRK